MENKECVKICLLGKSGVGKTCIIKRFKDNQFDGELATTLGGSYSVKNLTINNKEVQCDLWDTAGQEKYHSITKHFYKDAYIICLVYDITDGDSFKEIKEVWYEDLKKNGEKYTVIGLVGNKTDMYEKEQVNEEEARQYAESIGALCMLVSAKNGDNINLLFEKLVAQYLGPEFSEKVEEIKKSKGEVAVINKNDAKKQKNKKKCC